MTTGLSKFVFVMLAIGWYLIRYKYARRSNRTPVLSSGRLNAISGADLHFKCENFQKVGAFKARGAFNAVMSLSEEAARAGVCTHSSGNHAAEGDGPMTMLET